MDMDMDQRVRLWDEINAYAESCGGDTSSHVGSPRRMDAVARIEAIVSEIMRLLADRDGWIRASGEHGKALRVWQEWAATLLDEHGRQPLHGQHGDEPAREVIAQLVGLAPGVPRCSRCGCFSTRHEVDDEELRECADCECEEYEP